MEKMERNAKRNVKVSVTRKYMFVLETESRFVRLNVGVFYFSSWLFLSYPSSRRHKSRGISLWAQHCQRSDISQVLDSGLISMSPIYKTSPLIGWAAVVLSIANATLRPADAVKFMFPGELILTSNNRCRTDTSSIYRTRSFIGRAAVVSLNFRF